MTQGRANYSMEFKKYAEVPNNVAQSIIEGKRLVSIPYFPFGGVIGESNECKKALLEKAKELSKQVKYLEIRQNYELEDSLMEGLVRQAPITDFFLNFKKTKEETFNSLDKRVRYDIRRAEKNNLQLETEFLNVDYTFFVEGNYNMRIAVEHENITKGKRRIYNFKKLINVNSPLKVLICYYKKNQNPEKISAFYKNKFEKYGQINSEFLLLIGEAEMEEKEENDQSGYYVLKIFSK